MTHRTKLVMGGSGFLGSTVTRMLVEQGERVRVFLRPSSSTTALTGLDVEVVHGDLGAPDSLRRAMEGIEDLFYCIVDTRAWLRDPAPLFQTNVEALRTVLDVALEHDLNRFVFTSTIGTLAINRDRAVTEQDPHNWIDQGGAYIQSRVQAEELVLAYAHERGLPAVAMCVATTYGADDFGPTPHGQVLARASSGLVRWYVPGAATEVVGIRDAAQALILAASHGTDGQRYVVSDRFMTMRELHDIAAAAVGAKRPWLPVPLPLLHFAGLLGEAAATVLGRDLKLTRTSVRLLRIWTPLDRSKATTELGWQPQPVSRAVHDAAVFYANGSPLPVFTRRHDTAAPTDIEGR
jgi:dihydroflavonol-4-reductase